MWNPFKRKKKGIIGRISGRLERIHASAAHHTKKKITIDHHQTPTGRRARRVYSTASLLVLVATTILWAGLSAETHSGNADQLVDPYLFESWSAFQGAGFPGAHTFLLKWPIFLAIAFFDLSVSGITIATILLALATVVAFAAILHKIEKRPMVFGTICLFLALVLLLIPAQPYAGALLPLNMGMLATRNIEYILYIVALILIVRTERLVSWACALSLVCLTILFASDKLFFGLSIGGALLMFVFYWLVRNRQLMAVSVHWLFMTVIGALTSMALLASINATRLTQIVGEGTTNPFGIVSTLKDAALGAVYAVLGLATNLGANPAYDATILKNVPGRLVEQLFSLTGLAYVIAIIGVIYGLRLLWRLFRTTIPSLVRTKPKKSQQAKLLALLLIFSTLASIGVFVVTNHYYPVDARYLTIALFALFVVIATELRVYRLRPLPLMGIGALLIIGIMFASIFAIRTQEQQIQAGASLRERNALVADALASHEVDVLLADYWRAMPLRTMVKNQAVMPLSDCSTPSQVLSSSQWQPDLKKKSFAYLLSLEKSLAGYPDCTLAQVLKAYGKPNSSLLIRGKISDPKELLLFYNHGIQPGLSDDLIYRTPITSTVLPVDPNELPATVCEGATIMNVVAHQDDDLLFMNPDIINTINGGMCTRTVYLTAGDSGQSTSYWIGRELGAEAAYDVMLGGKKQWTQHVVRLGAEQYVTIASPRDNPKISLIFFNLPDGSPNGAGFAASRNESLSKLRSGAISEIHSADGQSKYNREQLVDALKKLMELYAISEVRIQADVETSLFTDHSDHIEGGHFATEALDTYNATLPEGVNMPGHYYVGYPVHGYDANVMGEDLALKQAAFFAYARYDDGVCKTAQECSDATVYGAYLERQYTLE